MKFRNSILPAVVGVAALASVGFANAGIIDFESTASGTYSSLSFNGDATLTFLGGNGLFEIIDSGSPGSPVFGQTALSFFQNPGPDPFKLSFSGITNYVQVGVGDYNSDVDNTFMQAFDAADNLIGSASYVNPQEVYGGGFLTIAAANIAYVKFWDDEPFAGAVYWDSISYENRGNQEVPEPATLGIVALGLLGLRAARRTRKS